MNQTHRAAVVLHPDVTDRPARASVSLNGRRAVAPPEELAVFCTREHPRLVGALALYCGDRAIAEELAEEAIVRVCEHWEEVRRMRAPGAWVHRVAMNLANSHFRRRRAERRALRRAAGGETDHHRDPDAGDAVALHRALRLLPPKERAAVVLRYYLDLPSSEAADLVGSTPGAVRVATHRGLNRLRELLGDPAVFELEEATDAP